MAGTSPIASPRNSVGRRAGGSRAARPVPAARRAMPFHDLADRTVLVTGGAAGIGYEICRVLLRHGARVAVLDKERAVVEQAAASLQAGARAHAVAANVADREAMRGAL